MRRLDIIILHDFFFDSAIDRDQEYIYFISSEMLNGRVDLAMSVWTSRSQKL